MSDIYNTENIHKILISLECPTQPETRRATIDFIEFLCLFVFDHVKTDKSMA